MPDANAFGGCVEIKTPTSARKVSNRLKHASVQLGAHGGQAGITYLSLLRLESEEQMAIDVAQRFVDDGTLESLRVIHANGAVEVLEKKDTGLGS